MKTFVFKLTFQQKQGLTFIETKPSLIYIGIGKVRKSQKSGNIKNRTLYRRRKCRLQTVRFYCEFFRTPVLKAGRHQQNPRRCRLSPTFCQEALYVTFCRPSNISCFPAYHQEIQTVALLQAGQDALSHPRLSGLRARLHELPGVLAVGENRGHELLFLFLTYYHMDIYPTPAGLRPAYSRDP